MLHLIFRRTVLCVAALAATVLSDRSSYGEEKGSTRHLADAKELVKHLDLAHTNYEHGKGQIVWSGTRESHADCSGFLDELLMHSYGYDRDQFKKWFDSHRPSAARYHTAIAEQRGFHLISRLQDVQPGDVLAVKYLERKDNTGHVMLVAEAPRRMKPKQPVVEGAEQWEVPIIDSSESGHGPSDTRHKKGAGGKDHDGLGAGVLRIYTDNRGTIAGFTWSTLEVSKFKSPKDEHLVIGRLKTDFKP